MWNRTARRLVVGCNHRPRPSPRGLFGRSATEASLLYWALVFLIIAIIAAVFGFGGIAVAAVGIAKILFFIFLVIFVVTLIAGIAGRRRPPI
jgi:uncharacterized membrane protein YtjA (UPF0391 family)